MIRSVYFSIFLIPFTLMSSHASPLSTIGSAGDGNRLYACSTMSVAQPHLNDGRGSTYVTQCYKIDDHDNIASDPKKALLLSPGSDKDNVVSSFFWYRNSGDVNNQQKMETLCASYHDHFKNCDWAKNIMPMNLDDVYDKAEDVVKDAVNLDHDLTSDDNFACVVALCLATPGGWTSESSCIAPVKKLFRVLVQDNQFPKCI